MTDRSDETARDNRDRKVEGRAKRRRFVQGTRAYTHALTNSIAKRADSVDAKHPKREERV